MLMEQEEIPERRLGGTAATPTPGWRGEREREREEAELGSAYY